MISYAVFCLKKVYERISEFHKQHSYHWTPAPLLKRLAEEGKTFESVTSV